MHPYLFRGDGSIARSGPPRTYLMPNLHPTPIVRRATAESKRSAVQRCRSGRRTKADRMPDASPTHHQAIVSRPPGLEPLQRQHSVATGGLSNKTHEPEDASPVRSRSEPTPSSSRRPSSLRSCSGRASQARSCDGPPGRPDLPPRLGAAAVHRGTTSGGLGSTPFLIGPRSVHAAPSGREARNGGPSARRPYGRQSDALGQWRDRPFREGVLATQEVSGCSDASQSCS
jgi:hypothetical protein